MFCQNCGAKLNDNSKFCFNCGEEVFIESNIQTSLNKDSEEYDKEILKMYLYNLRNMECAKNKICQKIFDLDNRINSLGYSRLGPAPYEGSAIDFGDLGGSIFTGVVILIGGWLLNFIGKWLFDSSIIMILAVIAAVFFIGFGIYSAVSDENAHSETIAKYQADKALDEKRIREELIEKEELTTIRNEMYNEWQEADSILTKSYSIDIVPTQFRNLWAIYYLYDYLSTSNESFTTALMQCNLDAIKQKLDTVIAQQQEIILNQAIIMAQNEEQIRQNEKQIQHLANIEKNSQKAAKYSEIAASNSEACAWIGLANYIR